MDVHSENTVMAGDRMYTDILAGVESGTGTLLVLSRVTRREDLPKLSVPAGSYRRIRIRNRAQTRPQPGQTLSD